MRREGRVHGKPTNKSRVTGRCRSGKTRCRSCRDHPVEKARAKRMGRYKRFGVDVRGNPALADFILQAPLAHPRGILRDDHDELWCSSEDCAVEFDDLASAVNRVIEAAFAKLRGEDERESTCELARGAPVMAGDGTDIEAEGSSVSQAAAIGGCTLSEESWSDVDLFESERESSVEDDWSLVDDEDEV